MQLTAIKLITIIAEGILEERILADITRLGARGYNVSAVHGHGTRGITDNFWEGAQVKIESLVAPAVAQAILQHLADAYFDDYAVVAYVHDVEVIRGAKYI